MAIDTCAHGVHHRQPCAACGRAGAALVPGGEPTAGAIIQALELEAERALDDLGPRAQRVFRELGDLLPDDALEELLVLLEEVIAIRERHPQTEADRASLSADAAAGEDRIDEIMRLVKAKMTAGVAAGRARQAWPTSKPPVDHGPN
jgi:hypothetical protein